MAAESGCVVCTHRADDSAASSCETVRLQQAGIDRNARAGRVAQRRRGLLRVKDFSVRPSRVAVTDGRECDGEAAGGLAIHGGEPFRRAVPVAPSALNQRLQPTRWRQLRMEPAGRYDPIARETTGGRY